MTPQSTILRRVDNRLTKMLITKINKKYLQTEEIYTKRVSKNKTADEWKSSQLLKAWHCVPKILKTHKASDKLEPSRKKRPSNSTYLGRVKYYRQKDKNAVRLTGICSQTV